MISDRDLSRVVQIVNQQESFSICLPVDPSVDAVSAGTAFYLALSKLGKSVVLSSAGEVPPDYKLTGVDKIQKDLAAGGDNLVVSFPYQDGSIDKVTYNIEGDKFNLVIQPRQDYPKLDPSQVEYNYTGGAVGALFVLDCPNLDALGDLYLGNQRQFTGKDIINLDRHIGNANFGTVNIVYRQISSLSEIILQLIERLNVELDRDIATNLYSGVAAATNNFAAYSVNADTFETSAKLLKAGAVKKAAAGARPAAFERSYAAAQPARVPSQPIQPRPPQPPQPPQPSGVVTPRPQPPTQSRPAQPIPPSPMQEKKGAIPPKEVERKEGRGEEETPKEWLKPKIFKGRNLV